MEVVQGDVLNYTDVLNAVKNVTAVVVALGTRNDLKPTTLLSDGIKNILDAMKDLNVQIISVCLSAFLFYDEDKVPPAFKDISADHRREYQAVKNSGLKYIAVLPPHIAGKLLQIILNIKQFGRFSSATVHPKTTSFRLTLNMALNYTECL